MSPVAAHRSALIRCTKFVLWLSLCLLLAIGGSALYMWFVTPEPGTVALPVSELTGRYLVFVQASAYHSSIVVEQPAGWRLGHEGSEDAPFVEFGWGERTFFMESNYCPEALVDAALLPSAAVVYVRGLEQAPDEAFWNAEAYVKECSGAEVLRLIRILEQQFRRTDAGERAQAFPPAPCCAGRFYPGRESYVIWWNCNEWTVRMMREAGLASSAAFVGFAGQVGGRLIGFERMATRQSNQP